MTSNKATPLSLEQKAALTSGAGWWDTVSYPQAGIPAVVMSDGPHGLRFQESDADHLGLSSSAPATCFPPAVALGSSWDLGLTHRVASALGREAQFFGVNVLLGPGINIKRSPLCGRNFEYFSEDPLLSGALGVAWVKGLQSQGVGASLKHFAANNQETDRMTISADIAARPLQEIYLRAFRRVVMEAKPWTVMCSYNRINGLHASQNPWLLTEILRDEWGFNGVVVSDWGAVVDRVKGLAAGMDLEMPSSSGAGPARVAAAVRSGELDEVRLDLSVARLTTLAAKSAFGARPGIMFDAEAHHALAREAAVRSAVLLKNDGGLLPLDPASGQKIAVIGEFARTPRYQGAGSSQVVPTQLDTALDAIKGLAVNAGIRFAPGFTVDGTSDPIRDSALRQEAVRTAAEADVVVLFLGLPASYESEGFDREHIELPAEQTALLEAVSSANRNVVVVLANGSVVRLSGWADRVPAILEGWLGGQAGGSATADLLFGRANPSGRLTETIPLRIEDTPAYLDFPGEGGHVSYGEGLFVGYRHYDARKLEVSFPFGHGLSYTSFEYSDLRVDNADGGARLAVRVRNSGDRAGREVVQAYVQAPCSRVQRPERELKGFATIELQPGEAAEVVITVPRDEFAYYDVGAAAWLVEELEYSFQVGTSSRDLRLAAAVHIQGDDFVAPVDKESTLAEWFRHPVGGPALQVLLEPVLASVREGALKGSPREKMIMGTRLGQLAQFPAVPVTEDQLDVLMAQVFSN
ncbi:glycoside hydrolase family 3 C-terminal domain-containing protein [Arthrobacter sp. MI7-26]|uniref:glycoside hydrolase family 3 C-terminal domain-containing protein n=1 Tax=Arthrobacter sp. MI7-26 TaxID=2993653 RepID=UPI002248F7F1|nr:glycoside hydrolase family 3 C-terminal domain-containing protein [Arthrobacter sp. MI7-26]MCX2746834.1 glycoside hydrolase family 3 C-terminal domain-containing protein [Arthrobacter sp. MI7-26]